MPRGEIGAPDFRENSRHETLQLCPLVCGESGRRCPLWPLPCRRSRAARSTVTKADPPAPTVGVVESRRMSVPIEVTPNGTTRALEDVTIRARVRGFLTERHFAEGAMVKKGQLLLVIDEEPYQVALQSAQGPPGRGRGRAQEGRGIARVARSPRRSWSSTGPSCCSPRSRSGATGRSLARNAGIGRGPRQDRGRPQALGIAGRGRPRQPRPGEGRLRGRDRLGPGPGLGRQGRGPRRRAEPGLLPDVRPDRRPDRRGPGQGRQPGRAGLGRRRGALPTWPRSSSSTRWASTSGSARATSTAPPP